MADPYTLANGDVRWRARWRTGAGERETASGFLSRADAVAHEEKMRTKRREGKPVRRPKTRLTVHELWQRFWAEEVTVAKTRGTQTSYKDTYAAYVGPHIGHRKVRALVEDPQLLKDWRARLARQSEAVLVKGHAVASSMFSFAVDEGEIPYNPLLALARAGRRRGGRKRKVARAQPHRGPVAVDPAAWFLVMEYLRRSTRPPVKGDKPRTRRNPLDRERDALLVAIGFIGGFRLPSEALGLTREDVKPGRLFMEGRSSAGEYAAGSKTGPPRDLPLLALLAVEFERVELAYAETGSPLGPRDFWICTHDRELWSASQAENWRERDFRPVARRVAKDFPQFSQLAEATPYWTRHTFISCCLQAGLWLATIAEWCGTSIQMISQTYGRMIRRYEGLPAVPLNEQLQTAKLEAMSLSSAPQVSAQTTEAGSTDGSTPGYLAA